MRFCFSMGSLFSAFQVEHERQTAFGRSVGERFCRFLHAGSVGVFFVKVDEEIHVDEQTVQVVFDGQAVLLHGDERADSRGFKDWDVEIVEQFLDKAADHDRREFFAVVGRVRR